MLLKKFLQLKKGEEKLTSKETVVESKLSFGAENNAKVVGAIPGDLIKPFLVGEKYVIVKLLNKVPPKTLPFEEAKSMAKVDYEKVASGLELENVATKVLENFQGENIGYVSRDSFTKIKGLSPQEALSFLNQLFSSTQKQGKISVDNKIVLYKINDTRLASYDEKKDEAVKTTINNLLNQELMNSLVKNLENRYEVQSEITFNKE